MPTTMSTSSPLHTNMAAFTRDFALSKGNLPRISGLLTMQYPKNARIECILGAH
jgi:hypothetical protein